MQTFCSYSFGCRVNQAEKEALDQALIEQGFSFQKEKPDIFIINTCAVTVKAEREARQLIYKVRKEFPRAKLVVTGCAVTTWIKSKEDILKNIDLAIDNLNKEYLANIIVSRFQNSDNVQSINRLYIREYNKYLHSKRSIIKIQDGCNRFCTYCIVPYLRGRSKSFISSTIVDKINEIQKDINEVILTAINTEAYGTDTGETLIGLIDQILKQTKIKRLSFGSINPWSITTQFIRFYKKISDSSRFVDYFHIPIQSGSNKILKLMKRDYTQEDLKEKFESLARLNPFIYFGTDAITGFLEESDRDFEETYNFLEKSPVAKFHVFRFSMRENTAAYYLAKKLKITNEKIKKARTDALITLGQKKYHDFQRKLIGQTFDAMFIKKENNGFQEALLKNQMPVIVKSSKNAIGHLAPVKVTDLKNSHLIGKIT